MPNRDIADRVGSPCSSPLSAPSSKRRRTEAKFVIDFASEQTCSSTSPLVLPEYRYGGFGFRGPLSWEGVVEYLTGAVGADRLVFGSDIPFMNAALQLGGLVYARITETDKRRILGGNAASLFGLEIGAPA